MRSRSRLLTLLLVSLPLAAAAEAPASSSLAGLEDAARRCVDAIVRASEGAVACLPPTLVEMSGGEEVAEEGLDMALQTLADGGAVIEAVEVGTPGAPVVIDGRTFSVVPHTSRLRVEQGVLRAEGAMIAIRDPGSEQWTFMDGRPRSWRMLTEMFPDSPPEAFDRIDVPRSRPPRLER